jgi:hypothetical protein
VFDPAEPVTVPGTSAETYFDAYAYGGATAVAQAHARAEGLEEPLPYAAVPLETAEALAGGAALAITLPEPMDVFTGSELASFDAGEQQVPWGRVDELLAGAEYLAPEARAEVNAQVGTALWELLRSTPRDRLHRAAEDGEVATDVGAGTFANVGG